MDGSDDRIGSRIAQLRTAAGLKQSDLSGMLRRAGLNWSQATLSKVESGQRPVRLSEATTLASVLDVELGALLMNPDYVGGMREAADRQLIEARTMLVRAQRRLWRSVNRSRAIRLLEEIRAGSRGPFAVHGVDHHGFFDYLTDSLGAHEELSALLESFGLADKVDALWAEARRAVEAWLEDESAVPTALREDLVIWKTLYADAVDEDEQTIDSLANAVFEHSALAELGRFLAFVEFVDSGADEPYRIEGLAGGEPEMEMPMDMLSSVPGVKVA